VCYCYFSQTTFIAVPLTTLFCLLMTWVSIWIFTKLLETSILKIIVWIDVSVTENALRQFGEHSIPLRVKTSYLKLLSLYSRGLGRFIFICSSFSSISSEQVFHGILLKCLPSCSGKFQHRTMQSTRDVT
jgi:hypothetical protein